MSFHLNRLLDIMARLRDPSRGCPWDIEQTFKTIAPYTIEEAYEVAEAVESGRPTDLRDELGDLLLQVVFHAQMARETGWFDFDAVAEAICGKMVRRHPHVFGDMHIADAAAQTRAWEDHKALERRDAASDDATSDTDADPARVPEKGRLSGVPNALPALTRAAKLQKRAAHCGFDWAAPADVLAKIREETDEIEEELARGGSTERLAEEIGDLLFAVTNFARKLQIDPETALHAGSRKFERRFQAMEGLASASGQSVEELSLDGLERLWQQVKDAEIQENKGI